MGTDAPSASPWQDAASAERRRTSRATWWWLAAATLFGAGLRCLHILVNHPPAQFLFADMLQNVGRYYTFLDPHRPFRPEDTLFPPGLMWLGALGLKLRAGEAVEALAPLQALLSTAAIPLAFLGLRRFFGERAALLASWLLAIDPLAIGLAGFFLPDAYLAFCLLLALALLRPSKPLACLLAGAALGAAALFGGQALALALLWAIALWIAARGRSAPREPRKLSAVALALGVLAVVGTESFIVSRDSHHPVLLASGAGAEFYVDHCEVRPLAQIVQGTAPQPLDPMLPGSNAWPVVNAQAPLSSSALYFREGLRCVEGTFSRTAHQLLALLGGWPLGSPGSSDVWPLGTGGDLPWARAGNLFISFLLLPLAFGGLWLQRRRLGAWLGFGLPALAAALVATVFAGSPRLRASFDPFLLGAAAWGGLAAWEGRPGERLRAFLRGSSSDALLMGGTSDPATPRRSALLAGLVVAGLALIVCYPLTQLWWYASHEWEAYLLRLFEWVRDWRDGQLFPRWAPDLSGGYGMPHFDFFAPGVFIGAGPLVLLGVPLQIAMKIWVAIVGVAGSLGAFLLVRGETKRDDAALVAGVAFAFTPYRFVDLYMRGDLAEYAALCFIPLALWCYRELARCSPSRRVRFALGAAAAHAGILLSHTITGQWATEAIAVVALLSILPAWSRGDRRPALATAMAMAGAVGLAAFYVIPALLEKKFAHLEILTNGYYNASDHLVPAKLFLRFRYFDFNVDGSFRDPHATRMPFTIGIPLVACAGLALLSLFARNSRRRLLPGLLWFAVLGGLLFLMTPAAEPLWPALPFGDYIGFPWRLLALVAAFGAAAIGASWAAAVAPGTRWRWPLALAAVIAIGAEGEHYVRIGSPLEPPRNGVDATYIQKLNNPLCSGEHLPQGATFIPSAARTRLAVAVSGIEKLEALQPHGNEYDLEATASGPADIDLETYWFPGWAVDLRSGPGKPTVSQSPVGLIRVHLPAAGHYQVQVAFHHTPVRAASELLTLLTLLLIWPVFRFGLRGSTRRSRSPTDDAIAAPIPTPVL